jgi:raffinose/stachyose/melibiose transport system substrate-binding protein
MKRYAMMSFTLLSLFTLLLAGCTTPQVTVEPTGAPQEEMAEPTEAPPEETGGLSEEPVTLTFWWEGAAVGNLEVFQKSFDRFTEMHPNVTIEVVAIPFEDMLRTFPLALNAGTGPDISMSLPLESTTYPAAQAGHLLELTEIGEARGWWDKYDMKAIEFDNRALDGIYGVPYEWTAVGVYYNTEIFEELGLEPPQTLEEFEALMETIKQAGITPISVGGKDGWPLVHVWQSLVFTNVEYETLRALEDRDPSYSYVDDGMIEAANKVLEWFEAGYLDPNLLSTGFTDANDLFINGEVAMNIGGTWVQQDFRNAPFEVRFFAVPPMRTDIPLHLGGFNPANDIVIVKDSPNSEWAIELLDFLLSEENMTLWWENGFLVPYRFDELPAGKDELQADIYRIMQANGPGHFITVSMPETNQLIWANMQEIVAQTKTPEEAFSEVQEQFLREAGQ